MAERVFLLPDPGEGLEEAEIVSWLVAEGDTVELNQPFVEVETAKATVEIPSPHAGVVARLHASEGDTVRVGSPLVTFEVGDLGNGIGAGLAGKETPVAAGADPAVSRTAQAPEGVHAEGGPAAATPAVRKLAKDLGVELSTVSGTGPGGRVTADDVTEASGRTAPGAPPAAYETVAVSPVRREIARRLTGVAAIPQVTTFRTVDCSALDELRSELGVSPLPIFVATLAAVATSHPRLNAAWSDDGVRLFRSVHAGIAVDTDRGLMVPVVRDAGARGVRDLAAEIARLADAARAGTLTPTEASGSTISVSNTGSYGSEAGTPLLNPGNAVTVALGVIEPRALVVDGNVVARPACTISLTFDHRVLDGASIGRALTDLVERLQDPERLRDLPG
jgi:2-oxoisovalerate dehydrogenase E2 component (dihydrolipoyl transacylase)